MPLPQETFGYPLLQASRLPVPKRQLGWLRDECLVTAYNRLPVDLLHLTSHFDLSFGWPLLSQIPKAITVYDLFALSNHLPGYRRLARPIYHWMAWKIRFAQGLLCISQATAQAVQSKLGRSCPMTFVTPLAPTSTDLALQIPRTPLPEEFLLLCPCWPPHKNVAAVLRALAPLGKGAPPLVVAGQCPPSDLAYYKELAGQVPVVWLGPVEQHELNWLYQNCRGFVFPSLREGFGLTPLEAMSWGAPVMVSNRAPMTEVVDRCDWHFDPDDPDSVQKACLDLWKFGRQAERTEWAKTRASLFSWDKVARETVASYRTILGRSAMRSKME